ncbi:MAG TPA: OmpW family outer membrane protein [Steroidobacteraceae bacterium]
MKNTTKAFAVMSLLARAVSAAYGDGVPDNTMRIGAYYVQYHSHADDISGPFVPTGLNLHVNDVETLYLAYVRRLSTHFDLELAAGLPPVTKTEGRGPAMLGSVPYNGQVISTARWFAPSVLLNYKFFDESYAWRPYVGVGVNYVHFYDRDATAAGNAASGGPTSIKLPDSVGPAATVGMSYHLRDRWSVYASYSATIVKSKLTADTAGVSRTSEINFGPRAVVVAAGYSF